MTALAALAAAGFVMIFSGLVTAAVIVLFGGRGSEDGGGDPAPNPYEYPGWPPS